MLSRMRPPAGSGALKVELPPSDAVLLVVHAGPTAGFATVAGHRLGAGLTLGHAVELYDLDRGWRGLLRAPAECLQAVIARSELRGAARCRAKERTPTAGDGNFEDTLLWHIVAALEMAESQEVAEALATALCSRVGELLAAIGDRWCLATTAARGGLAPWQLRLAKDLMLASLRSGIETASLADACGLSAGHFAKAFKQSVGVRPRRWLATRRLERAKQLLGAGELGLAEIARACGYADQSHLTRSFANAFGEPPARWRRSTTTRPPEALAIIGREHCTALHEPSRPRFVAWPYLP